MDPVGHARSARSATRRSAPATGCAFTNDVVAACPNTAGAIWRQVSQSMQVESTKKSPGAFSITRLRGFATALSLSPILPLWHGHSLLPLIGRFTPSHLVQ